MSAVSPARRAAPLFRNSKQKILRRIQCLVIVHDRAICAVLPISRNAKADGASVQSCINACFESNIALGCRRARYGSGRCCRVGEVCLLLSRSHPCARRSRLDLRRRGHYEHRERSRLLGRRPLGRSGWSRLGVKRAFIVSIFITAAMVGALGLHHTLGFDRAPVRCRCCGAVAFVTGGSLAAAAASGGGPARASTVLGLYFGGVGMGILVSALSVPPLLAVAGWQAGWLSLGAIALIAGLLAVPALSRAPNPIGLRHAMNQAKNGRLAS